MGRDVEVEVVVEFGVYAFGVFAPLALSLEEEDVVFKE